MSLTLSFTLFTPDWADNIHFAAEGGKSRQQARHVLTPLSQVSPYFLYFCTHTSCAAKEMANADCFSSFHIHEFHSHPATSVLGEDFSDSTV